MAICRICQHSVKSLKFQTEHIGICTRCVNTLNGSSEPARNAEERLAEKLGRGMQRNAERDLHSDEDWKRQKAKRILADLGAAVAAAQYDWITRLLEKPENSTRDFKIMRAYRRGLLRMEGFADYPEGWIEVAHRIRKRDGYKCTSCRAANTTLDVHHIIHLSNHGTNQQSNLITLCRRCHEAEHKRVFDWLEAKDPEQVDPIRPPTDTQSIQSQRQDRSENGLMPQSMPSEIVTPLEHRTELRCPSCLTELTIPSNMALLGKVVRCPKCTATFNFGMPLTESRYAATPAETSTITIQQQVQTSPVTSDVISDAPRTLNPIRDTKPLQQVSMWTTDLLVLMAAVLVLAFTLIKAFF